MQLSYKVKSLIDGFEDGEVNVIAHQANCFHKMGSGIAPLIAAKWPAVRKADNKTEKGNHRKLGSFSLAIVERCFIYNLYGQFYPGRNTDYYALRQAIRAMVDDLMYSEDVRIGLPKLGCGIGGGEWSIVSKIIEEELYEYPVTIYVLHESEIPKNNS